MPNVITANVADDATAAAVTTANHFKKIRAYYTSNVISKVIQDGNLQPTVDHKAEPKGIPLPATFIHDMSALLAENNTTLKLFSTFPFPNRSGRPLDDFQKEAWDFLTKYPDGVFRRTTTIDGKQVVRVAIGDRMVAQECVTCHNTRSDSPKTDWKLGDLRGVLEVSTGIDTLIAQGSSRSNKLFVLLGVASLIVLGILGFHLRSVFSRSKRIEDMVSERTEELATATQKLDDSYRRMRSVVDTVIDGIITIDDKGLIENFNAAAERMFGYTKTEVVGRNVKLLMPGPYRDEHDGYLRKYRETGEAKVIGIGREVEGRRKDGSIVPLDLAVSEMEIDGQRKFTGILRDITERKNLDAADQARRDVAERMRAVVETVVDGIITIDEQGIIQTFNRAAEKIFGYSEQETVGQNVKLLMPGPYRDEHDGYLRNYRETGEAKVIGIGREVEGRCKDGSTVPLDLSVSEMEVDGRRMFTGIVRDISERKKMDAMKKEFVSTVSHELRTPLTSISGSLGLIAGGALGEISPDAANMIDIAYKNSQRLTHLINDLLDIEKLAAGQMNLDLQPQELMPLVEQALKENETYGAGRRVKLSLVESEPGLKVHVDGLRLLQVLSNLISNAVKYSPEDGTVRVALKAQDSRVRVTVTDDGPGVPAEFKPRIFEKFAQADSSDTRKKGGTGLGLAISRELIEHMGGEIGFESVEGEGATFFFELPIWNVDKPTPINDPLGSTPADAPRILVVEDDHDAAHLLGLLLTRAGYAVDVANNGEQALNALERGQYQAMTLDLMLPDMSGLEIIKQVRERAATADLPIMVVSGKMEEGELLINGDIAHLDWLPKPIDEKRLFTAMHKSITMNNGQPLRVLHVEDDIDLQQVVRAGIKGHFEVEAATTLADARARLSREHFDVVLLDLGLPDGSGWDLLPEIRSSLPRAKVIILSGVDVSLDAAREVEAVLLKSKMSPQQLLDEMTTQVGLTNTEGTTQ